MIGWIKRIEFMREAGDVKRLHTVRTVRSHTVAVHTYGAMSIAFELCALNNVPVAPVLLALLVHDAPELETGDAPAPVKRANLAVRLAYNRMEADVVQEHNLFDPDLDEISRAIVKAADCLDLGFAALEERLLGNRTPRVYRVLANILSYTTEQMHIKGVAELRAHLQEQWTHATYGACMEEPA